MPVGQAPDVRAIPDRIAFPGICLYAAVDAGAITRTSEPPGSQDDRSPVDVQSITQVTPMPPRMTTSASDVIALFLQCQPDPALDHAAGRRSEQQLGGVSDLAADDGVE